MFSVNDALIDYYHCCVRSFLNDFVVFTYFSIKQLHTKSKFYENNPHFTETLSSSGDLFIAHIRLRT